MPSPLDRFDLRQRVQACIDAELVHQRSVLAEIGPDAEHLIGAIEQLLAGGKRLRAAFLYWGHRAAGQPDSDGAVRLATSMEFFQGAALIHDDVMDGSDTRRGMPSAHRALAAHHGERGWVGDGDRFGEAGAILAGNLCLNWTEELFATSGLPAEELVRARPMFDRMRTQLMAGQFLDVVESVRPWDGMTSDEQVARATHVITYKSAKYSIEHPLLIGALAGGLGGSDLDELSTYGLELGRAFQLRDDILGVFGDPETTGKPAGDDLREGKRTVLVAQTLKGADESGRALLNGLLGRPDLTDAQVADLRQLMTESGGVAAVEAEIEQLVATARAALARAGGVAPEAREVLEELIDTSTLRSA